jgi:hypothetical protein
MMFKLVIQNMFKEFNLQQGVGEILCGARRVDGERGWSYDKEDELNVNRRGARRKDL